MDYIVKRVSEDELYHFGVKGMKWGIRRKSSGRKLYDSMLKSSKKEDAEYQIYSDISNTRTYKKKVRPCIDDLSNKRNEFNKKANEEYEYVYRVRNKELGKLLNGRDINLMPSKEVEDLEERASEITLSKLKKDKKYQTLNKDSEKSREEYYTSIAQLTSDILGDYNNIPISQLNNKTTTQVLDTAIRRTISDTEFRR